MQTQLLYLLYPAAILAAIVGLAVSVLRAGKRQLRALEERFGKPPEPRAVDAEDVGAYHAAADPGPRAIDDITWNDLEMDRIYARVNACASSVGEEYLYALLHRPAFSPERLERRERLIHYLQENPGARFDIQKTLFNLGRQKHNGLALLAGPYAKTGMLRHAGIYPALAALPILGALLLLVSPQWGIAAILVFSLLNCGIYVWHKLRLDTNFATLRYLSSMLRCCKALLGKRYPGWEAFTGELGRRFAPFARITGRMASTYLTQRVAIELQALVDLAKMIVLYDILRYNQAMKTIAAHREDFCGLFEALGEIDAAVSILSFRLSLPAYCLPVFHEANTIQFTDIRHPLLDRAVPNSGELARGCIVTGSNASGKSTFIKALAVNGILAQTIHTCCAAHFKTRPLLVMTSMALRDSIVNGESYFVAEIKSIRRILAAIEQVPCVCYIDEILRGTNTPERIAASVAVLRHIARQVCLCAVASHDIELTCLLSDCYDNWHFTETVADGAVTFDYVLRPGPATTRNALKLLRLMGVDEAIVAEAEAMEVGSGAPGEGE